MQIICDQDKSCKYLPIAVIAESGLSEITILKSEGLVQENILFV
jgi:hypothetical protein